VFIIGVVREIIWPLFLVIARKLVHAIQRARARREIAQPLDLSGWRRWF
jgi:hypothetical protein